jgi:hypothetical protein
MVYFNYNKSFVFNRDNFRSSGHVLANAAKQINTGRAKPFAEAFVSIQMEKAFML